jgi:hypothetical protein
MSSKRQEAVTQLHGERAQKICFNMKRCVQLMDKMFQLFVTSGG